MSTYMPKPGEIKGDWHTINASGQVLGRLAARIAILLQGAWAAIIAMTGRYDQILNYVEAIDVLFFGLTGASLLIFRSRERREGVSPTGRIKVPLHPITTALFVIACWSVSIVTIIHRPQSAGVGLVILLIGAIVFRFWQRPVPAEERFGPT